MTLPIRILPMSDQAPGFKGRSIEDVQTGCFLGDLPSCNGRYCYPSSGLNAATGTVVLFQYRARIIASAMLLRDEKFARPRRGYAGAMWFDVSSIQTFDPLEAAQIRDIWLSFRVFRHVKQYLNPAGYAKLKRRLKNVKRAVVPLSRIRSQEC